MLIKNLEVERGLCNGSRGVVERFQATTNIPIVRFASGRSYPIEHYTFQLRIGNIVTASRTQIPLVLAWAVSIHKSQGMSLDRAYVNLTGVFEVGQVYVALSRVRSLHGLRLTGWNPSLIRADLRVKQLYDSIATSSVPQPLPLQLSSSSLGSSASTASIQATSSSSRIHHATPKLIVNDTLNTQLIGMSTEQTVTATQRSMTSRPSIATTTSTTTNVTTTRTSNNSCVRQPLVAIGAQINSGNTNRSLSNATTMTASSNASNHKRTSSSSSSGSDVPNKVPTTSTLVEKLPATTTTSTVGTNNRGSSSSSSYDDDESISSLVSIIYSG
jgi:hypothetical protein